MSGFSCLMKNFIDCLLSLTHNQWIFRNLKVHFKINGLTATQHNALETRVKELMSTLPSALLSKDCYLLLEDFHLLGEGPAAIRQVWVASMESALGAAAKYAAGTLIPGSHLYLQSRLHRPHRFRRKTGCPCICQPTPVEYGPNAAALPIVQKRKTEVMSALVWW